MCAVLGLLLVEDAQLASKVLPERDEEKMTDDDSQLFVGCEELPCILTSLLGLVNFDLFFNPNENTIRFSRDSNYGIPTSL